MTSLDQSPDAGSPDADTPTYPPAPWTMDGQLWLSLFRVGHDVDALRPRGVYGVALVSYEEPSPLTYSELLVARVVKDPVRAVSITDIWVDSPASVAGGRGLWAIPKELADFRRTSERGTVRERTSWSVDVEGRPVVRARFTDASHAVFEECGSQECRHLVGCATSQRVVSTADVVVEIACANPSDFLDVLIAAIARGGQDE